MVTDTRPLRAAAGAVADLDRDGCRGRGLGAHGEGQPASGPGDGEPAALLDGRGGDRARGGGERRVEVAGDVDGARLALLEPADRDRPQPRWRQGTGCRGVARADDVHPDRHRLGQALGAHGEPAVGGARPGIRVQGHPATARAVAGDGGVGLGLPAGVELHVVEGHADRQPGVAVGGDVDDPVEPAGEHGDLGATGSAAAAPSARPAPGSRRRRCRSPSGRRRPGR